MERYNIGQKVKLTNEVSTIRCELFDLEKDHVDFSNAFDKQLTIGENCEFIDNIQLYRLKGCSITIEKNPQPVDIFGLLIPHTALEFLNIEPEPVTPIKETIVKKPWYRRFRLKSKI